MAVEFVAYIDESGDPGLSEIKPKTPGGASEWLVLGCVLLRVEHDRQVVQWMKELVAGFKAHQTPYLHFTDLNKAKKLVACEFLAQKPVRVFIAASNKQNIENYENPNLRDQKRHWYYWWMTRLLLERVTHFCKRMTPEEQMGNHKVRLIFSRRGRMRYADLNEYLTKIYWQSKFGMLVLSQFDLCWEVIDFDEIFVLDHKARAGLQFADVAAGAFFQAMEKDRPADCDPVYAKALKPIMGRDQYKRELGYGLKTMPDLWNMSLVASQKEIFEFYGFNPEAWEGD